MVASAVDDAECARPHFRNAPFAYCCTERKYGNERHLGRKIREREHTGYIEVEPRNAVIWPSTADGRRSWSGPGGHDQRTGRAPQLDRPVVAQRAGMKGNRIGLDGDAYVQLFHRRYYSRGDRVAFADQ